MYMKDMGHEKGWHECTAGSVLGEMNNFIQALTQSGCLRSINHQIYQK